MGSLPFLLYLSCPWFPYPCNLGIDTLLYPALSLNTTPKACLLALLFIFLAWFCITAKSIVLDISPLCLSAPLCKSSPPPSWPVQATSSKPQAQNSLLTSTSHVAPSAYLSPLRCTWSSRACPASGFLHPPLLCHPGEASSLWSLSIPSLGEMNTCGLCYQCFNFYQYGVWFMMIHGFRPPHPIGMFLPATAAQHVLSSFAHSNHYQLQVIGKQETK